MREAALNDLLLRFGVESWKPVLGTLLLPPAPLLLLMLIGALWLPRRRWLGWFLVLTGAAGIWLSSTLAVGEALQRYWLAPAHALNVQDLQQLQSAPRRGVAAPAGAIVVLGGGRERWAPEFGAANLNPAAMERLRYGLWLARETGAPLAFSGGIGHAQPDGPSEAEIAARIAQQEFGRALKWSESRSRDTRENAVRTVELLRPAGVTRIVLVTHGWHMKRALRAFEQAIERSGGGIALVPAPMGLARDDSLPALRWLPSAKGFAATRQVLHEMLGMLAGA